MRLPKSIKVAGHIYRVEPWRHQDARANERLGECDRLSKVLRIDTSFGRAQTAESLLHELLHAITYEWNLHDGRHHEEAFVNTLGKGLLAVLRENRELLAWLGVALRCK